MALASKNGFLYVFDRVTGKPLWPIEERPVPQSDVPGEVTSKTQPFPTVVPPFARQGMTVKDMYTGFMKPEEVRLVERPSDECEDRLLYAAGVGVDTINLPSVNGGALVLQHRRESDERHGLCCIERHAVDRQAGAGGRIHRRECGRIDSGSPAQGAGAEPRFPTPEEMGRAVYEQNCQVCHGPELKGDRGPALDTVVEPARRGQHPQHHHERQRRRCRAFSSLPASIDEQSDGVSEAVRPGASWVRRLSAAMQAMVRSLAEPPYPEMSKDLHPVTRPAMETNPM